VINGVVASVIMMMTEDPKAIRKFTAMGPLRMIGWLATGVMGAAVIAMTHHGLQLATCRQ
jgi:hypothetical protein